jgi:hypothetical protein
VRCTSSTVAKSDKQRRSKASILAFCRPRANDDEEDEEEDVEDVDDVGPTASTPAVPGRLR